MLLVVCVVFFSLENQIHWNGSASNKLLSRNRKVETQPVSCQLIWWDTENLSLPGSATLPWYSTSLGSFSSLQGSEDTEGWLSSRDPNSSGATAGTRTFQVHQEKLGLWQTRSTEIELPVHTCILIIFFLTVHFHSFEILLPRSFLQRKIVNFTPRKRKWKKCLNEIHHPTMKADG